MSFYFISSEETQDTAGFPLSFLIPVSSVLFTESAGTLTSFLLFDGKQKYSKKTSSISIRFLQNHAHVGF